jgi:PTS system fructose-specific IIC component
MPAPLQYPLPVTFVRRLTPERIAIAPGWRSFEATVDGLIGLLVRDGALAADTRAGAVQAVSTREAQASTALLDIGVGVPHARLAAVRGETVALALDPGGFYEAVPTVPIHIVALVLSPPAAADEHLRILASIATSLRSRTLRTALLRATDPAAALALLAHASRDAW